MLPVKLDERDIETIAQRIAQLLLAQTHLPAPASPPGPVRLLDAAQLARALGVRRDWVYRHAQQLGAIRLGGPHGRLRFDLQRARSLLADTGPDSTAGPGGRRAGCGGRGLDGSPRSRYGRGQTTMFGRAARQTPPAMTPGGIPDAKQA